MLDVLTSAINELAFCVGYIGLVCCVVFGVSSVAKKLIDRKSVSD